ncbi:hypothetical protein AB0I28_20860 [Phytomonospora sp. NPDC050363]|uniref:hypothetical protein n=1 Tax=Phytomonospora sp. NPDC050363 TaxID=3155642 RepID=UPI0033DF7E4F
MDVLLVVLLVFLGLLAGWGITEAVLSVRRRRRLARDPRVVWRNGRKVLPREARSLKSTSGSSGETGIPLGSRYDSEIT